MNITNARVLVLNIDYTREEMDHMVSDLFHLIKFYISREEIDEIMEYDREKRNYDDLTENKDLSLFNAIIHFNDIKIILEDFDDNDDICDLSENIKESFRVREEKEKIVEYFKNITEEIPYPLETRNVKENQINQKYALINYLNNNPELRERICERIHKNELQPITLEISLSDKEKCERILIKNNILSRYIKSGIKFDNIDIYFPQRYEANDKSLMFVNKVLNDIKFEKITIYNYANKETPYHKVSDPNNIIRIKHKLEYIKFELCTGLIECIAETINLGFDLGCIDDSNISMVSANNWLYPNEEQLDYILSLKPESIRLYAGYYEFSKRINRLEKYYHNLKLVLTDLFIHHDDPESYLVKILETIRVLPKNILIRTIEDTSPIIEDDDSRYSDIVREVWNKFILNREPTHLVKGCIEKQPCGGGGGGGSLFTT